MGTFTAKVVAKVSALTPGVIGRNPGASIHATLNIPIASLLVFMGLPWPLVAVVSGAAWFAREITQNTSIKRWSTHKHIEWIAPFVAGTVAAYVTHIIS